MILSSIASILFLLALGASRSIEPLRADVDFDDGDSDFGSIKTPALGLLMQMSYNTSIPVQALKACEEQQAATCPSPSDDGRHKCVSLDDVCDQLPQCPGGEDETPVICFFHEMHSRELARLRQAAIKLVRSTYQ